MTHGHEQSYNRSGPGPYFFGGGDPPGPVSSCAPSLVPQPATENGAYSSSHGGSLCAAVHGSGGEAEAEQASSSSALFGEGSSAEMRVATWRKAFALTADADFAYVFMNKL